MATSDGPAEGASPVVTAPRVQKGFLLVVVVGITLLLLYMVRHFLVAMMLAGVFAAMARPVFLALQDALGGRRRIAGLLTVLGLFLLIVVPVVAFLALVVAQAVEVSDGAGTWISEQSQRLGQLNQWARGLPVVGPLVPDEGALAARASEVAGRAGTFVIGQLRAATAGTVSAILQLFVMLYALYFFLMDGPKILSRILYYTPLDEADERKLAQQFVSVTRATIKGSILIGLLQGGLAGAAFFILALPAAAFWSTVMAVLSVIPVLGSGIIWAPAALILTVTGRVGAGIALAAWGLLIVGMIDNFLRPALVGRDTKMHDLLVLLSTFGGIAMFGLVGFILGPIIAALFMTAWDLYGDAFQDLLPESPQITEDATLAAAGEQPAAEQPAADDSQAEADDGARGGAASSPDG